MNFANEIKTMVSAKEAAEFYGYKPNRSGFICCPFHGEDTPSLKVYDGARGFHCFGCGAHGDVTDLVARLFDLPFLEAQAKINEDFRLGLPTGKTLTDDERRKAKDRANAWQRERSEKEKRIEAARKAYMEALDRWVQLDIIAMRERPKRGEEHLKPSFVEVLVRLDRASAAVDEAQDIYYSVLLAEKG